MPLFYLETSALVKLYVQESGTRQLIRLVNEGTHRFAILSLSQVELRSAIRKRQRMGDIEERDASHALAKFDEHVETKFLSQLANNNVMDIAKALVDHHPLRAYDVVQLAGCIALKSTSAEPPTFVCADHDLLLASASEGINSLNPVSMAP